MTIYILGAGPTGLAAAHGLFEETGQSVVVLERAMIAGGLAQTVAWENVGEHDLGPHKIFSPDKSLTARVKSLIPTEDWLHQNKLARIYMNGHFLSYPPSPLALRHVFGTITFIHLIASFGWTLLSRVLPQTAPQNFADDLSQRVGPALANKLFFPIARKLWGEPETLDLKLSRGRIQTPSILELIRKTLNPAAQTGFETLTYDYPCGGLKKLWQAIIEKTSSRASYHFGESVTAMTLQNGRITALTTQSEHGEKTYKLNDDDFVLSTLPLGTATRLLVDWVGQPLLDEAQQHICLNDMALVFLHIDKKEVFRESWLIVPDPELPFHRLSEQKAFDPSMVYRGTILCAEIMGHAGKADKLSATDAELATTVISGLEKMGVKNLPVLSTKVIRLPRSYPVYKTGFQPVLDCVMERLDTLANFRSIGRQGAFNYIGTLDAMDIGYGFARWIAGEKTQQAWQTERQRTSSYPVLD